MRLFYNENENFEIEQYLKKIYARLHSDGNDDQFEFLKIDAIDYCTFGNSKPFRIKIRNILNDNFIYNSKVNLYDDDYKLYELILSKYNWRPDDLAEFGRFGDARVTFDLFL